MLKKKKKKKESTFQCRRLGSIPGQGIKIPHAAEQLSPCTVTADPKHYNNSSWATARDHAPQQNTPQDSTEVPCTSANT